MRLNRRSVFVVGIVGVGRGGTTPAHGGSALLTEVVFGLPGVGMLTWTSLQNLDLPMIMGTVMYASFFVVIANAAVDVVYAWLDPRVRRG